MMFSETESSEPHQVFPFEPHFEARHQLLGGFGPRVAAE